MSTANVKQNNEIDILSIVRELEGRQPEAKCDKREGNDEIHTPDPTKLLESLQKKRQLINMLDGYADVKGIGNMKEKLNEAIEDLEEIIGATA